MALFLTMNRVRCMWNLKKQFRSANSELNVAPPVRAAQNGAHVQNPLHGTSDAPASVVNTKPTNPTTTRSNRPVPRAPSSQTTSGVSDTVAPTTPAKGDSGNAFSFQFGSISPGLINGMQIPARTSSAPPNLDEQKRDQFLGCITITRASRYNYPMTQSQQTLSFMNPSAVSALPVAKPGPPMHTESSNSEHTNEVTVKPASGSRGEKVGPSSITVSAPITNKGDSPKLLKPPRETTTLYPQKDSELASESSVQQSKSVSELVIAVPPSATVKNPSTASAAVSLQKLPPSTSSSLDEPTLVLTNAEGRRKETVRMSDSFKDHQKKLNKKDIRETQSLNQDGNSETVEGKVTSSLSGTSRSVLESTGEPIPDNSALPNSSGIIKDSVRIGEGSTCEPSNKSDLELEGAVSDSSVDMSHAKDGHTLQELQLKQDFLGTAEQGGNEPSEVLKQDTEMPAQSTGSEELLEGIEQTENIPNLKEPMVGGETGSMEPEQGTNKEAVSCSSEVIRTVDSLVRCMWISSIGGTESLVRDDILLDAFSLFYWKDTL